MCISCTGYWKLYQHMLIPVTLFHSVIICTSIFPSFLYFLYFRQPPVERCALNYRRLRIQWQVLPVTLVCREALALSRVMVAKCPHVITLIDAIANRPVKRSEWALDELPGDLDIGFVFERVKVDVDKFLREATDSALRRAVKQLLLVR